MSLTFTTWQNSISNIAEIPTTDTNFQAMLPNCIDDFEQRLYRELQLLNTNTIDASGSLTAGNRNFTLPSSIGTFIVVQELNIITPATAASPDSGTRNAAMPVSKEYLNLTWNSVLGSTVPQYFAMETQGQVIVGPWPNASYPVEVIGTIRPAPLSSTNVTTILTVYFPDLVIAASMVFVSGYMKNYGAGPGLDDPRQGVSWETHYQTLLKSAETEEQMKKFRSQGWSSQEPAPTATPPRT